MARPSSSGRFVERNIAGLTATLEHAARADSLARRGGWLQMLDPRAKILAFGLLIVAAVSVRRLAVVVALWLVACGLSAAARIPWRMLATQVWVGVLAFTGLMALPSVFLVPGETVGTLPWVHWQVTAQGLHTAGLLVARAETTATLALTLVLCTGWTHALKALRVLRVPTVLVVILGMTHRYVFLLLQLAGECFVARRSRLVGALDAAGRRQVAAGAAGVLLDRSLQLGGEVYEAMQSRGFRGEVYTLDDFRWQRRDTAALGAFSAVAALALWCGWR